MLKNLVVDRAKKLFKTIDQIQNHKPPMMKKMKDSIKNGTKLETLTAEPLNGNKHKE